jgi:ADP-ribosylglycohydrolase
MDGTVLTLAVVQHLVDAEPLAEVLRSSFKRHPYAGYGWRFMQWATAPAGSGPYGSLGNGAALRVSPVAWARHTLDGVLADAARTAAVTHDHVEGIRGAEALAAAIFLGRTQPRERPLPERQATIRELVGVLSGYDLEVPRDRVRETWACDFTASGSVPPALIAALTAASWEEAITIAQGFSAGCTRLTSLAGAVAEGLFGVPEPLWRQALTRLDARQVALVRRFEAHAGGLS